MTRVSIVGVLAGGIIDIIASNILTLPIGVYLLSKISADTAPDRVPDAMISAMHAQPLLYALQLLVGLGCTVLGGYAAAWIARREETLNGVLASWAGVAVGIYAVASGKSTDPLLLQILLLLVTPPFSLLGGWLRLRQTSHRRPPQHLSPA